MDYIMNKIGVLLVFLVLLGSCDVSKKVSKAIEKDSDEVVKQIVEKNGEDVLKELVTKREDLFTKDSLTITIRDTINHSDTIVVPEVSDSANFQRKAGEDGTFIIENDDLITTVSIQEMKNNNGEKIDFINVKTTCKGKTIIRNTDLYLDFPVNVVYEKPKPIVIYRMPNWSKWVIPILSLLVVGLGFLLYKAFLKYGKDG